MRYTKNHMRKVREAITASVPGARFEEWDYGYGLAVADKAVTKSVVLFDIAYPGGLDEDGSLIPGSPSPVVRASTRLADVPRVVALLTG